MLARRSDGRQGWPLTTNLAVLLATGEARVNKWLPQRPLQSGGAMLAFGGRECALHQILGQEFAY